MKTGVLSFGLILVAAAIFPVAYSQSIVQAETHFIGRTVDLTEFTIQTPEDEALYPAFVRELKEGGYAYEELLAEVKPLVHKAPSEYKQLIEAGALSEYELVAIYFYTTEAYPKINGPLRSADPEQLEPWRAMIMVAASGLNKLPFKSCQARRSAELPEDVLRKLDPDTPFVAKAFFSTTVGKIPPYFKRPIEMDVTSSQCRNIAWMSQFPAEDEVLFAPGSVFVVTDRTACVKGARKLCVAMQHLPESELDPALQLLLMDDNEEPSPGTLGITRSFTRQMLTHRTYRSQKDLDKTLYFDSSREGRWVNTTGRNRIDRWEIDTESNLLAIWYFKPDERRWNARPTKAYFFIIDEDQLGYVKGPEGGIQEYYRFH